MPQDPGFQGNKGDLLKDAGAQTNYGGKLDQPPCKKIALWANRLKTSRLPTVCKRERLSITHVRLKSESLLIRHSTPAHFHNFPFSFLSFFLDNMTNQ